MSMNNGCESCLDNIVTVSDVCSGEKKCSSSGFDLMDAPEISINNLASIASETYVSGLNLARSKMRLAINLIRNDLIAVLNTNNFTTNIESQEYNTSVVNVTKTIPASPISRGITITRSSSIRGKMKRLVITKIEVSPVNSGVSKLSIQDNGLSYENDIELIGGQINTVYVNHMVQGDYVRIILDNTNLDMYSAQIMCKTGCYNTEPNKCGFAESFNGSNESRDMEGYGLNVFFDCECDYDVFLCDLAKTYVGELIWMKARILLLDERINSNRMNDWVLFDRETTRQKKVDLEAEYVEKWNALIRGMYGILKSYRDDCINCRGIKWVVNG